MRCRDVLRLASEYVDGELDDRRSSALRGHLRTCSECERAVADNARVRGAAAELEALDPPASLWAGIEQRLASAEIEDARRSRAWLWWQAIRPQLPYAAIVGAAAIAFALWLGRDRPSSSVAPEAVLKTQHTKIEGAVESDPVDSDPVDSEPVDETHVERAMRELRESDGKYLATISELRDLAAQEREEWSPEQTSRYDQRVAEFERVTTEHRKRLAFEDTAADPRAHDTLFALYQAEIEFLLDATLGEL